MQTKLAIKMNGKKYNIDTKIGDWKSNLKWICQHTESIVGIIMNDENLRNIWKLIHFLTLAIFILTPVAMVNHYQERLWFSTLSKRAWFSAHSHLVLHHCAHVQLLPSKGGRWQQLQSVYETVSHERMPPCSSRPNKRAIYYNQHDPLITHK